MSVVKRLKFIGAVACVMGWVQLDRRAFAVGTSNWIHTTDADWKSGTFDNVVATNLGDLKLSRAVKTLLEQDPQVSTVNALAEGRDGAIYAATGPKGILLRIKGEDVAKVATIEDATNLFSLLFDKDGRLLIGTGGEAGRILRIDKPGAKAGEKGAEPVEVFKAEGVQYIWSMRQTPDGNVYAATGPTGQLWEIKPDGSSRVILDSDENNLTSLLSDGKDMLYVGTDPNGLVYRVNRKTGDSFVLFDAPESEISALVMDRQGNIYASTAEARDEGTATGPGSPTDRSGRPEGGATGVPIQSEPPKAPEPPKLPDPQPGKPEPIPKNQGEGRRPKDEVRWNGRGSTGQLRPYTLSSVLFGVVIPRDLTANESGKPDAPGEIPAKKGDPSAVHGEAGPTPKPPKVPGPPSPPGAPGPAPTPGPPTVNAAPPLTNQPGRQPVVEPNPAEPKPEGNAVYRIDRDGFVTEVFRQPVLILSMVELDGSLLLATGGEGQLFQVSPAAEETLVVAKVEPREIMCLLPAHDGRVYLGTANAGGVAAMSSGYAAKGTYTSPVLDATQISRFGKVHLHGTVADGTTIAVSTRSGNVHDATEKGWSQWTADVAAAEYMQVGSPSARFLQYRLTFTSKDQKQTPVIGDVTVAYQIPNLPPQVKSVKIVAAPDPAAMVANANEAAANPVVASSRKLTIGWEAADPNNDPLQFGVYFRRDDGADKAPWILLKDKLSEATYEWDTRSVADGRYEVRVTASDAASNEPGKGKSASRVGDPVDVDNTPPVVGDLKYEQAGADVKVSFRAVDRTSVVAGADYSVDSSKDWQAVLPSDNIWDSPEEASAFMIAGLTPGAHQVTVRATDAKGNQAFESLFVTVRGPAASAAGK